MKLRLLYIILLSSFTGKAQFPEDWIGSYSGTMYLSSNASVYDSIDVQLELQELIVKKRWSYKMTYNSARFGEMIKDYEIILDSNGYLMDEQNGLYIEMAYMKDVFYEFFEVGEMLYSCTMRRIENGILFEIFGASSTSTRTSNTEADEQGIQYTVVNYKPLFAQTVLLLPTQK
jgi:hypothetical protein